MGDVTPVHFTFKVDTIDTSVDSVKSTLQSSGVCGDNNNSSSGGYDLAFGLGRTSMEGDHICTIREHDSGGVPRNPP